MTQQPMLFDPTDLPRTGVRVSENSWEWRDAQMLRLVESVRFNPERLAQYVGNQPDRIEFRAAAVGG